MPRPVTLLLSSIVIVVGVKNKVLEVVDTVFITVPAVTVVLVSELNTLPVPAPDGKEPTSPLSPDSMISTSKLSPDANGAADEAPLFDTVSF